MESISGKREISNPHSQKELKANSCTHLLVRFSKSVSSSIVVRLLLFCKTQAPWGALKAQQQARIYSPVADCTHCLCPETMSTDNVLQSLFNNTANAAPANAADVAADVAADAGPLVPGL